jgi:hypothetical protein
MTLLQHEVDYISDRILAHISEKLVGIIRETIKQEMKIMTDQAITDLTSATDAILAELALVVASTQNEATALAAALAANAAASGAGLDPAIEAQVARLVSGTKAAAAAVAALQPPASPVHSPVAGSPVA